MTISEPWTIGDAALNPESHLVATTVLNACVGQVQRPNYAEHGTILVRVLFTSTTPPLTSSLCGVGYVSPSYERASETILT